MSPWDLTSGPSYMTAESLAHILAELQVNLARIFLYPDGFLVRALWAEGVGIKCPSIFKVTSLEFGDNCFHLDARVANDKSFVSLGFT